MGRAGAIFRAFVAIGGLTGGKPKRTLTSNQTDQITYGGIDVAFFEPTPPMRVVLRNTLLAVGFRRLLDCHSVGNVIGRLGSDTIDLLIVDMDGDPDGICKVVRDIRESQLGPDPFLAIMALTSNAVPDVIRRVLDVGCDDLITRPIAPKALAERTVNLVHKRKAFVVTPSYVGPDRRGSDRGSEDAPKIVVPNALRHKATGDPGSAVTAAALKAARATIAKLRIAQIAAQIGDEALRIKARAPVGDGARIGTADYGALIGMVDAVTRLISNHELCELEPLGASMAKLAETIAGRAMPDERALSELHLHGEAIAAMANGDAASAELTARVLNRPFPDAAE